MTEQHPALWATRTGNRSYVGRNESGAEVLIGDGPGQFTPGELLKLALATCHTLSADRRFAQALGEDFAAHIGVESTKPADENRYDTISMEMLTDLSGLDAQAEENLRGRVAAAIDKNCTIGHTLRHGAEYSFRLVDEAAAD